MKLPSRAAGAALLCSSFRLLSLGAVLLATTLLCGRAAAGPDPAAAGPPAPASESRGELEEIVVTAEKRETTVPATPNAMTAVTGNDLLEQNISNRRRPDRRSPRTVPAHRGVGQTEYEMRGLGSGGGTAATVGFTSTRRRSRRTRFH